MKRVFRSNIVIKWLSRLRDLRAKQRLAVRIRRLKRGNPGDVKPVGEGISEMRENYGPGYRLYYTETEKEIILLLCGGDKSTQPADIKEEKKIANDPSTYTWEEDKEE
ncbi:MAG: type II toxin-antitoxin system RelE/ParE family toxin [Spirochaetaceae bacterium]|jgi:putative addiction module killer protein|nr:type II toxin-antitoxin system RelE/ParE family toxin [Spirochaetaceae bacterium]